MTDNQDSVTAGAVQPPTDRPLTAGDWIEWHGGENPVPGQMVECRLSGNLPDLPPIQSECMRWEQDMPGGSRIIAYRLSRPATSAASEGAFAALICAILEDEGGSGAPWSVIADRIAASVIDENHLAVSSWTVRAALERIAGEQQYRSGYCQTDITVEPALSADEAQSLARETLAALASPPVSERERGLEGALWAMVEHFERVDGDKEHKAIIKRATTVLTAQPAGEPTHG